MASTLACVACERDDVVTMVCMVLRDGTPEPVCAGCFGNLMAKTRMSGTLGCAGCAALTAAFEDFLEQMERQELPLAGNPKVPHDRSCLLGV